MSKLPDIPLLALLSLLVPLCVGAFIGLAVDSLSVGVTWGIGAWVVQAVVVGVLAGAVQVAMKREAATAPAAETAETTPEPDEA